MKRTREVGRQGEPTVTIGGRYLHSRYAPRTEAQRFLDQIDTIPSTATVLVVGDGIGVLPHLLIRHAPDLRVFSIEPVGDELEFETYYVPVSPSRLAAADRSRAAIRAWVRSVLHSTEIGGVRVITWPSIDLCCREWRERVEGGIHDAIRDLQSELATVAHFGRQWITNALRTTLGVEVRSEISVTGDTLYVAASGPTITALPDGARPATVSSALHYLRRHRCDPLFVLHTDGGIWARRYVRDLLSWKRDRRPVLALPLRAGPVPDPAPLLLSDGSIVDLLAPDAIEWPALPDQPSVGLSLIDLTRRVSDCDRILLAGIDLCSRDLIAHARPHLNERYIATVGSRLQREMSIRYARLRVTGGYDLRWPDGARAYHGDQLEALVEPLGALIARDGTPLIEPILPSPVWQKRIDRRIHPRVPVSPTPQPHIRRRSIVRPSAEERRKHAQRLFAEWREALRSRDDRPEARLPDLLLYLAPVEYLRDLRRGEDSATTRAIVELDRIAAKAGFTDG